MYGTTNWNWTPDTTTTDFSFEADVGAINETVTLDIDIATGGVSIVFVDDESLLYVIDIEVLNTTLETDGDPTVTFTSNTIGLDYTTAGVNITLGSGVNYTIDVTTGGIAVVLGVGANVGDMTLDTTTGGISLIMTDDVALLGNATFDVSVTTGGITIIADLPTDVGGSIECAVTTGDVDITATGWTMITANHYETSDYDTALQTLTIIAQTTTGGIDAIMT